MRPTSVVSTARQRRSRTTTGSPHSQLNVHYLAATNAPAAGRSPNAAPGGDGPWKPGPADRLCRPSAGERGLPRAAERQLKAAESLEPASLQLERQQAWVALDLREWRQMDLLVDDVVARSPRDLEHPAPGQSARDPLSLRAAPERWAKDCIRQPGERHAPTSVLRRRSTARR